MRDPRMNPFSKKACFAALLGVALASAANAAKKPGDDTSNPAYKTTDVVIAANTTGMPAKSAGFVHPGVLLNRAQLDEIKRRVAASIEPQKSAFEALKASKWGALDYTPHPRQTVECGSNSRPDLGCKDEQADSEAAYGQALLWYITGNKVYAENAVKIMDAWSTTLTGRHTNNNGQVQASWTGDVFPRAAEIIRFTYGKWPDDAIARFQNMLTMQFLPSLIHGTCENGNKELTQAEAIINIGVFTDNRSAFDHGIQIWRGRAPAYIYLKTDGPKPIEPPGCGPALWGNKGLTPQFVDGLLQETARDSQHANMALAGLVDAAETARQQGIDLYGEQAKRIMAALEFQAQYLPPNSAQPPENLEFNVHPTWEIAYNHFHDRLGFALPRMAAVLPAIRPTGVNHHMTWETLTHAGMGITGLPPLKK
jgi:Alginate lyase